MNLNNVQAGTGIQILRTPALRFSGHAIKTDQKYGTAGGPNTERIKDWNASVLECLGQ